jgi:hypothetical protein
LDCVIVALVEIDTQRLVEARKVAPSGAVWPPTTPDGLSSVLCGLAESMVPPPTFEGRRWSPITHVLVTLVCRDGRVIDTVREHVWMHAWRRSNQLTSAIAGDVYAVTPHGWTGVMDERAGFTPRTRPALQAVSQPE